MSLEPWQIESSTYVIDDQWLRLRSDTCRRSNGAVVSPYYVTTSHEVVLIREYHHGIGRIEVGLPGGSANGDEQMALAARRELLEETGYSAAETRSLGSGYVNWGNQNNRIHYFLALGCVQTDAQNLDENEEIEIDLVPLRDFRATRLQQSFHLTTALLALDDIRL